MTAMEALKRARATMACGETFGVLPDCDSKGAAEQWFAYHVNWHRDWSSALLDGFSVREITAAERELER